MESGPCWSGTTLCSIPNAHVFFVVMFVLFCKTNSGLLQQVVMLRLQIDEEMTAGDLKEVIKQSIGSRASVWMKNMQEWALYLPIQTDRYHTKTSLV